MANENMLSDPDENSSIDSDDQLMKGDQSIVSASVEFEYLDLSEAINDPSSALHALTIAQFNRPEALMSVCVIDLANVFITPEAKSVINRAHFQPLYFVEAYAHSYRVKLLRELTRSKEKGKSVLDPKANEYEHAFSKGQVVVAKAETVEVKGQLTRRLMISLKSAVGAGEEA
jgi:hypothetical protein